jgi:hypothetical protein
MGAVWRIRQYGEFSDQFIFSKSPLLPFVHCRTHFRIDSVVCHSLIFEGEVSVEQFQIIEIQFNVLDQRGVGHILCLLSIYITVPILGTRTIYQISFA